MADLINMADKRKEKDKEKEKDPEPKVAELYRAVTGAMNFEKISFLPPFPVNYFVVEAAGGRKVLKKVRDREVGFVDLDEVAATLLSYTQSLNLNAYQWTVRSCLDCAKFWLFFTPPIKMPKAVGFDDTGGLVFHRLPWQRKLSDPEMATPTFDELFDRIDNGEPLKKWIGSLFFPESDRQSYIWCYGQGRNGKGALSRFLRRVFGNAYSSETVPDKAERFWTAGLVDKRLVAFNDCNNYGFPSSGLFKSLTGGDHIRCEEKFGKVFTAELTAKFIFLSNERPALSSGEADTRRIILCEFGQIVNATSPTYERRLWIEGNAFILKCIESYVETNADHSPLASNAEAINEWIGIVEDSFESLVDDTFHVEQSCRVLRTDLQRWLKEKIPKRASQLEFMKFVGQKYGVKRKCIWEDGKSNWYYVGMRLKHHYERS